MRPQDIVALMLAGFLFLVVGGKISLLFSGVTGPVEVEEAIIGLIQFIAGGLLTYIGLRDK